MQQVFTEETLEFFTKLTPSRSGQPYGKNNFRDNLELIAKISHGLYELHTYNELLDNCLQCLHYLKR